MAIQHLRSAIPDSRPIANNLAEGQLALNYESTSPGVYFKDDNGVLVKVGPVHVGSSAPNSSPAGSIGNAIGEQWLDTTGGTYVFKVWDGSAWRSEAGEFVNISGDTMTGALGVIAGSAAAPGVFVSGDTDTGIYSPGANELAISTNGTGRLFVDASGNVGVGATSPANDLDIVKTASGSTTTARIAANGATGSNNANLILNNGGSGNSTIRFDYEGSTDYASIGTTASNKNIVFSTNSLTRATIDSSGRLLVGTPMSASAGNASVARIQVVGNSTDSTASSVLALNRGEAATAITSGEAIGNITFGDSSGNEFGLIQCIADAAAGSGDYPGRLVFSTTADGASSPTERMRISSGGNVLIGCQSLPSATVEGFVASGTSSGNRTSSGSSTSAYNHWLFYNGNGIVGSISTSASATTYATSSDYRLKENVVPLTGAADRLNQLQVHRFNFIADPDTTVDGFLAHEAQAVVPECVTGTKDEVDDEGNPVYQGIDQSKLVPLLTAALQEALQKIETLEQRLNDAGIA